MKKYGCIYLIRNLINGKMYIGQTLKPKERFISHFKICKKPKSLLSRSIKKYGKENFEKIILDWVEDQEDLDIYETHYIEKFDTYLPYGYNIQLGGKGVGKHSEETRKKISKSLRGNKNKKGKKHSEETRKKISKSLRGNKNRLGIKLSDKSKNKMIQSLKKTWENNTELKKEFSERFKGKTWKIIENKRVWLNK